MSGEASEQSPAGSMYAEDRAAPVGAPTSPEEWDALTDDWQSLRQGYYPGDARHAVLECARHLEASVAGGAAEMALWVLGLYYIGDYVVYAVPHEESEARVRDVMAEVGRTLDSPACPHTAHPCDDVSEDEDLEELPAVLELLAHPERDAEHKAALADESAEGGGYVDDAWRGSWYGGLLTRQVWACPRNLAGFARAFLA